MSVESLERIARNKNVARAAARQLSTDQLVKLADVINEVIEQKQVQEAAQREEDVAKQKKLAEIRDAMLSAGLSVEDLASEPQKKKRGRPPKHKSH